ncbi:MAG: AmmeMemoRadiSam system protein A [Bacteroidales bacterium]|nr:AmmeMemoRadiSam system protein A [Bacteroidales bacterium]
MEFTAEEKNTLISIAEWSVQGIVATGKKRSLPETIRINDTLRSPMGAFVTVYVDKKLRGCIGTFSEQEPLYQNVFEMAGQAATEDRRFRPVSPGELPQLEVEISVLSPREKISGPEEIEIGKHGIYLIHGIRRATLLPQVAVKNNWSPVEFLECCAGNKLGLDRDSWKEAEIFVYEATVIR